MQRRSSIPLIALAVVTVVAVTSGIGVRIATAQSASLADGRVLASNCFNCHGTDGRSSGGFDTIAGESVEEIISEMRELRSEDEGIMSVHARGYPDEQVRLIAEYLASR